MIKNGKSKYATGKPKIYKLNGIWVVGLIRWDDNLYKLANNFAANMNRKQLYKSLNAHLSILDLHKCT